MHEESMWPWSMESQTWPLVLGSEQHEAFSRRTFLCLPMGYDDYQFTKFVNKVTRGGSGNETIPRTCSISTATGEASA